MSSHHIQIGDISPRIQYTGDGAQVAFTYPFPIFKDADIEVFEDTTLKTLTTDYTVAGAGDSSGGTVTFVTAPLTGVVVTLKRNITIARTSDFDESRAFRSKVINDELDTITAVQQQIQDSIERSLRLTDTDTAGTLTLPEVDTRKGKFLRFDATTGDPEAAEMTGVTVLSDADPAGIGTAAPGTSADVSRDDHVHGLPMGGDGIATAAGVISVDLVASNPGLKFTGGKVEVDSGTSANKVVKLDGSAKLPAVDGSALTGISGGRAVINLSTGAGTVAAGATVFFGPGIHTPDADEATVRFIAPFAGILKNMRVNVNGNPGASESFTYTLRANVADTSVVVTISNTDTNGSDLSNTASYNAGQQISVKLVTSGSANVRANHSITFELEAS